MYTSFALYVQEGVVQQAKVMEVALLNKPDYQAIRREQRQQVAAEIAKNKKIQTARTAAHAKAAEPDPPVLKSKTSLPLESKPSLGSAYKPQSATAAGAQLHRPNLCL
jgi:hypothetical protein